MGLVCYQAWTLSKGSWEAFEGYWGWACCARLVAVWRRMDGGGRALLTPYYCLFSSPVHLSGWCIMKHHLYQLPGDFHVHFSFFISLIYKAKYTVIGLWHSDPRVFIPQAGHCEFVHNLAWAFVNSSVTVYLMKCILIVSTKFSNYSPLR